MIQANELRIGNYLQFGDKTMRAGNLVNGEFWYVQDLDCVRTVNLSDIEPIPLTEKILSKCGFEKVNHINNYSFFSYNRKNGNKNFICDIYENTTRINSYSIGNHVQYLHQLQNLYFALTGKELEVEL